MRNPLNMDLAKSAMTQCSLPSFSSYRSLFDCLGFFVWMAQPVRRGPRTRAQRRWWASRLCTLRIRGFCLLNNATIPSTDFQQTNDCTHTDTTFILWQLLLTCFDIHPILPHILIAILHHGKAPSIDNHPNTELTHHSEAPVDALIWSLNKNDVIDASTLPATATTDRVY